MSKSSRMMGPVCSCEMLSCSTIDLAHIRPSSKIITWIINKLRGGHCFWSSSTRSITGGKITTLNWVTQFFTVAYDGTCSPNVSVRMAWISFGSVPCKKKNTWWQLASRCCWNRARRLTCFLSASLTRKDLQFGTWTDPSFQPYYRFRPTTSGHRSD